MTRATLGALVPEVPAQANSEYDARASPMPSRVDIRALLLIALDEKPPPNLPDRVMARVAALTTIVEFVRMLGAAPIDWITQKNERSDPDDSGNKD